MKVMTDQTQATVVADSEWEGSRLVTFHLTFPRFILAEFNTHRAFSRNSASSRAIPVKKQVKDVMANYYIPQAWPKNQTGMSAAEDLVDEDKIANAIKFWTDAMKHASNSAWFLGVELNVHKQIANRLLEPFMWHTVICSTTMPGLENFFEQRDHPDAQPEMQALARKMREALEASVAQERPVHLPFSGITHHGTDIWAGPQTIEEMMVRSISRCARVSYGRELEERTYEEDFALVKRLISSNHWSPLEHVGFVRENKWADAQSPDQNWIFEHYTEGNFEGPWSQSRHYWRELLPSIAKELAVT